MLPHWFLDNWQIILTSAGWGGVLVPLALNGYVRVATRSRRYTDAVKVSVEEVAIVFGAGVWEDGSPCRMLADRVQAGVELYKIGRVSKLLMTGDRSGEHYDEVKAMQLYARDRGVPIQDIILDPAGFSTYESCYRARKIFGIKRAVLITQRYHLPRAVYTACQLGLDAVGLGIPDWGKYRNDSMSYYTLREVPSTLKALWEVHVARPKPTVLEAREE